MVRNLRLYHILPIILLLIHSLWVISVALTSPEATISQLFKWLNHPRDEVCAYHLQSLLSDDLLNELDCYRGSRCRALEALCGRVERAKLLNLELKRSYRGLKVFAGTVSAIYWYSGELYEAVLSGRLALSLEGGNWKVYQVVLSEREKLRHLDES